MNKNITKNALVNALLTAAYIFVVVTIIFNAEKIFGPQDPETILVPVGMLLLFVISAAVTSSLVFGKPIMWYLDGKKKEAVALLGYTLGFLLLIAVLIGLIILAM